MEKNKPVFSLIYYDQNVKLDCGAAWDHGRASGSLNVAIDLSKLPERPSIRIKVFPTDELKRAAVLEGYLNQVLQKIEARKSDIKEAPKSPFFDCVVKHGEGWVNVGSLWNNSQNGNLDFQLKIDLIPEAVLNNKKLNALLVPNKKYFPRAQEGLGESQELMGAKS